MLDLSFLIILGMTPIYILLIVLGSSLLILFTAFLIYLFYRHQKMYENILNLLANIAKENKIINYKLRRVKRKPYDIYYETITHIYNIKVLANYKNQELFLKDKTNWQFIDHVEDLKHTEIKIAEFINLDSKNQGKKDIIKMILIYPNAKAIISFINQCELNFVYDDKEIYGTKIVTYENLYNRHNIIEGR